MKSKLAFLFFLLTFILSPSFVFAGEIEELDLASQLVSALPPNEYVYIGLGPSSARIMSLLHALFPDNSVYNLPYSRIVSPHTFPYNIDNLDLAIKQYLPTADQLSGRAIALIGFAKTGDTLANTFMALKAIYAHHLNVTPRFVIAPLADRRLKQILDHKINSTLIWVGSPASDRMIPFYPQKLVLDSFYLGGDGRDRSEFGEYDFPSSLEPVKRSRSNLYTATIQASQRFIEQVTIDHPTSHMVSKINEARCRYGLLAK